MNKVHFLKNRRRLMNALEAIKKGAAGCGVPDQHTTVSLLRSGAEHAPCDLERVTRNLADAIEGGNWDQAHRNIAYILTVVSGANVTTKQEEWATWIGLAQQVTGCIGTAVH